MAGRRKATGRTRHVWSYGWGLRSLPAGWESSWNYDGNGYKRDVLRRYEMVYVNGQPLRAVLSRAELVDGTFYVDEPGDKLYLRLPTGVSLTGALVEVGLRPIVLTVTSRSNLTLRNFAVERNMGSLQDKAVWISKSSNIVLEGMYFRWNAYGGVGTAENTGLQIRGSVFSDNGVMGLGGNRDRNVLLEDSEIARNNWRGWPAEYKGWDAIHKWLEYRDAVVRRIRVVDNWGNGFYMDTDNQRITFQDSLVSGNQLNGVTVEMNEGPITFSNNRICNNAFTGFADAQSNYVSLLGNQIFGNGVNADYNILFTGTYTGRYVTDYETGITTLIRSQYWTVTDNTVAGSGSGGWLWVHSDYNAPGAWSIVRNSFDQFRSQSLVPQHTGQCVLPAARPRHVCHVQERSSTGELALRTQLYLPAVCPRAELLDAIIRA